MPSSRASLSRPRASGPSSSVPGDGPQRRAGGHQREALLGREPQGPGEGSGQEVDPDPLVLDHDVDQLVGRERVEADQEHHLEVGQQLGAGEAEAGAHVLDPGPVALRDPGDDRQQPPHPVVGRGPRPHRRPPAARRPAGGPAAIAVSQSTMSARRSGGPSTSAWSRNVSTKDRKASRLTTGRAQHDRAVGPALLDRFGPDVVDGPRRLLGVDQQPGHDRRLAAQLPRLQPHAGMGVRGPFEGLAGADLHVADDAVDPEAAGRVAAVVVAREVPAAPLEVEAEWVHDPLLVARRLPAGHRGRPGSGSATGWRSTRAGEQRRQPRVGRHLGQRRRGRRPRWPGRPRRGRSRSRRCRRAGRGARPRASTAPRWRPRGGRPGPPGAATASSSGARPGSRR